MAKAIAVPFYYGMVECVVVATYCWTAWRHSWTKAPVDISAWEMMFTSYEILAVPTEDAGDVVKDLEKDDGFHYVDAKEATLPSVETTPVVEQDADGAVLISKASV